MSTLLDIDITMIEELDLDKPVPCQAWIVPPEALATGNLRRRPCGKESVVRIRATCTVCFKAQSAFFCELHFGALRAGQVLCAYCAGVGKASPMGNYTEML